MSSLTIPQENITPMEDTFKAIALEDIRTGDYVAISLSTLTLETIEVSLWRRAFGLPPAGMAMHNAAKGEIVKCAYRATFVITPKE